MTLKAENITFSYNSKGKKTKVSNPVLAHFSAEFEREQIVAVTGPNGCGKTTFGKVLIGILKQQEGIVRIDGINTKEMNLTQIGKKVGYAMQNPMQQIFCASVTDEVEYGLKNLDLPIEEIVTRRDYYLSYFQIEQYKDQFPFLLSQGEKQRLVLAAVLAMRPNYLILDEPTASLDSYRKKLLGEYLRRIVGELRCGIILISHDRAFISKYTDREINMQAGKK